MCGVGQCLEILKNIKNCRLLSAGLVMSSPECCGTLLCSTNTFSRLSGVFECVCPVQPF